MGKLSPVELFDSINQMPLANWEEFYESKDIKWFYKNAEDRIRKRKCSPVRFKQAYFSIQDQYSELTKRVDDQRDLQNLIIAKMEAVELYAQGDESQMNWINSYSSQIEELSQSSTDTDIREVRLIYQKHYGMPIDRNNTSIGDFLRIKRIVERQGAKNNDEQ